MVKGSPYLFLPRSIPYNGLFSRLLIFANGRNSPQKNFSRFFFSRTIMEGSGIHTHARVRASTRTEQRGDSCAVAVVKGDRIVGHVPKRFLELVVVFIRRGGMLACNLQDEDATHQNIHNQHWACQMV